MGNLTLLLGTVALSRGLACWLVVLSPSRVAVQVIFTPPLPSHARCVRSFGFCFSKRCLGRLERENLSALFMQHPANRRDRFSCSGEFSVNCNRPVSSVTILLLVDPRPPSS